MDCKKCSKCGETKPATEFNKSSKAKSGLQSQCRLCNSVSGRSWYDKNAQEHCDRSKRWHKENADHKKELAHAWYEANKENKIEATNKYRSENRIHLNAFAAAGMSKRRAVQKQATPDWGFQNEISILYKKAAEWGSHVDHVVPLRSKKVCGLHVWHNLQILPISDNTSKGNRYWPDMP